MSNITDEELERRRQQVAAKAEQRRARKEVKTSRPTFVPILIVGELIEARERAGYTQEDLAYMTGLPRSAIAMWETGKADPRLKHLVLVCRALHISADVLLGLDDKTPPIQRKVIPTGDGWTQLVIDPAPEDPDAPPPGLLNAIYNIGDRVFTPDGNLGTITDIRPGYYDRGDTWRNNPLYHVKTDGQLPGSPIVWWPGWKLTRDTDAS
jgi:transcriptional regulator with XRE-family HTH domain